MTADEQATLLCREYKVRTVFVLLVFLSLLPGALAAEAAPAVADPALEKRVLEVAEELRCLVCQNQTIADSNAPLAVDLRDQVREKMQQGMSNQQIVDYMVSRYGDFVRYRPPLNPATFLLWFGPALLLVVALAMLARRVRARRNGAPDTLTEAERMRARALLVGEEEAK